jgi:nucleoside-diphosphate-sugar epimerase
VNIGVTGCNGWLGKNLVKKLVADKKYSDNLRGIDIKITDDIDGINLGLGSVTKYDDCLKFTKGLDQVIHTVGIIHPKKVMDFYNINVKGTDNIVRACIENGVKRIIYISSNSVYGTSLYCMTEMTTPEPYMNYGISKLMAENLVVENSIYSDLEHIILRPCWFYGEGQPDRQTKLFKMIQKGKPMIFGDGNNLRSMSYVGNTIQAIQLAMKTTEVNEQYWIADERPYTTNEIYATIAKLLGVKNFKPRHIPGIACSVGRFGDYALQRVGKYNQYVHVLGEMDLDIACNINKAKRELLYYPKVDLEEGMRRSIEWCKANGQL